MLKKILMTAVILATSSTVALASGPYLGANIGVNNTKSDLSNSTKTDTTTSSSSVDLGSRGALAGIFGGYGTTVNQNVYVGGEAFVNYTNAEAKVKESDKDSTSKNSDKYSLRTKYSYGVSFIPGYMVTNQTMVYGRLGVVQTRFENKVNVSGTDSGVPYSKSDSISKTLTGGQIGGGVQTDLTQNLALRGEYVYTAYKSFNGIGGKVKPSTDQFSLGLVYKID